MCVRTGTSLIAVFGRCAAAHAISCIPKSCAGSRSIEAFERPNNCTWRPIFHGGVLSASRFVPTFWSVDNLAMQGRVTEARALFERLLTYAGRLGLFSEEIDTQENMALGNYPQAFSHIALINSALNLHKAEQRFTERHTEPIMAAITIKLQ